MKKILIQTKLKSWAKHIFSLTLSKDKSHYLLKIFFLKIKVFKKPKHPFKNANENTVLIIERQNHHGECLPSYIKYLNDLKFHVDILLIPALLNQQPFCLMPSDADYSIIECPEKCFKKVLQDKKILKYKHIIIATAAFEYIPKISMIQRFPILQKFPSLYLIEHDIKDIDDHDERPYLEQNRIFTLWNFGLGKMINPSYFGKTKITPKNDEKSATFIVVGALEKERKNHLLLFESIEKLIDLKQNFHVIIIGRNQNAYPISEKLKPYITLTGFIPYPQMFDEVEKADFFLTLLDPENEDHNRYITSGVTGSTQLILGFAKVPIIQKKFADFYGFDDTNALVYTDDMTNSMLKAIHMPKQKYQACQKVLIQKQQELFNTSEKNLKRILKNL